MATARRAPSSNGALGCPLPGRDDVGWHHTVSPPCSSPPSHVHSKAGQPPTTSVPSGTVSSWVLSRSYQRQPPPPQRLPRVGWMDSKADYKVHEIRTLGKPNDVEAKRLLVEAARQVGSSLRRLCGRRARSAMRCGGKEWGHGTGWDLCLIVHRYIGITTCCKASASWTLPFGLPVQTSGPEQPEGAEAWWSP